MISEIEKLHTLVLSGVKENIDLAFSLAKGQKIEKEFNTFLEENYLGFSSILLNKQFKSVKMMVKKLVEELLKSDYSPNILLQKEEWKFKNNNISCTFEAITKHIPLSERITYFYFNNSRAKAFNFLFEKLPNIQKMQLVFKQINLFPESFETLDHLTDLQLFSSTSEVFPSVIGKLKNLKRLEINYNFVQELPAEIGNLDKLNYLTLKIKRVKELPTEIGKLKALTTLKISDANNLTSLPNTIHQLENLSELDIRFCNNLVTVPKGIDQLSNLLRLDIHSCQKMEYIPTELGENPSLKTVGINSCKTLSELPSSFFNLSTVTGMALDFNALNNISSNIKGLKQVNFLNLNGNHAEYLPTEIGQLSNLTSLQIGFCKNLKELPDSILDLDKLEQLYIAESAKVLKNSKHIIKLLKEKGVKIDH